MMNEIPTEYIVEVFVPGYRPIRSQFAPERFGEAYALFEILSRIENDSDFPLTAVWSVEY